MNCISCSTNPAIKHPSLGYLPCKNCQNNIVLTDYPYEFVQDSVKQSRKEYADDILQSSRDGVLSKERLEKYGTKGLKVTQEQIDKAEYVWDKTPGRPYRQGNPKVI